MDVGLTTPEAVVVAANALCVNSVSLAKLDASLAAWGGFSVLLQCSLIIGVRRQ